MASVSATIASMFWTHASTSAGDLLRSVVVLVEATVGGGLIAVAGWEPVLAAAGARASSTAFAGAHVRRAAAEPHVSSAASTLCGWGYAARSARSVVRIESTLSTFSCISASQPSIST